MDIIRYNKMLYLLLLFWFECIILINSVANNNNNNEDDSNDSDNNDDSDNNYVIGEATYPTQDILDHLLFYQKAWNELKIEKKFHETYTFTFAWDDLNDDNDECHSANKYIYVENNKIQNDEFKTSFLNSDQSIADCIQAQNEGKPSMISSNYLTIDELYNKTIEWFENGLNSKDLESFRVVELMLNDEYLFPENVKLLDDEDWTAWDIPCFKPFYQENEDQLCDFDSSILGEQEKEWTFWITKEMQSFLGWSMIFLILIACSLGYCINWLKKKKSEKIEAWREKEEKQREEREKQKQDKKKRKGGKKRKSSKAKHRAHLEKSKKQRNKDNEYSSLKQSNVDDQDDNSSDNDNNHFGRIVVEEQKHNDDDLHRDQ